MDDPHGEDAATLKRLGYAQELQRGLGAFSNFALSLSIICILAGGVTSFSLGLCSVGGASIGLGWPLASLFALVVALTMGQVASAFPTAGGLYHWSAILGGRGWGWATAWFNLLGLLAVLAAINVGAYQFAADALGRPFGFDRKSLSETKQTVVQAGVVLLITASQALLNVRGIRLTARLTDFSGWWILLLTVALVVALLAAAPSWPIERLWTFENFSGLPEPKSDDEKPVWPVNASLTLLFMQGLLLPAYTLTGYDASAHAAEETTSAARQVPRGIVRSVLVSGVFGWLLLCAAVVAAPDLRQTAEKGDEAFASILTARLWPPLGYGLIGGIVVAQYLCGLATVTSTSRMTFAFARDGGLPLSHLLRRVDERRRVPVIATWTVAVAAVAFTLYEPAYATITAVASVLLYVSYVLPAALGLVAHGRWWTRMGPWDLGVWYRPLAALCVVGVGVLFFIATRPNNENTAWIVGGAVLLLALLWFGGVRLIFPGPPPALLQREKEGK
jgi:amino acid transporter